VTGLFKKAMGKADAANCHVMEARMVVMTAAWKPRLRKAWAPSDTPKMLPSPGWMFIDVMEATMKKEATTVS